MKTFDDQLLRASISGDAKGLLAALRSGANIEARDEYHWTALMGAVDYNKPECVEILIKAGANIEASEVKSSGMSCLIFAAKDGRTGIAALLLEAGATIDARDYEKNTALHWAAQNGHKECVDLLLARGANFSARNCERKTALSLARDNDQKFCAESISAFKKSPFTQKTLELNERLFEAAEKGDVKTIDHCLANAANIESTDNYGRTPLMQSASKGWLKCVRTLLASGADVNARSKYGRTALMLAAESGKPSILKALLAAGADVNATEDDGTTVLMWAAANGQTQALAVLLNHGADIEAQDTEGRSVFSMPLNKAISDILKKTAAQREADSILKTIAPIPLSSSIPSRRKSL